MVSAGAGYDFIEWGLDALRRGKLLEGGFGMLWRSALAREIRLPQVEDEALGTLKPAIEKQSANQGWMKGEFAFGRCFEFGMGVPQNRQNDLCAPSAASRSASRW